MVRSSSIYRQCSGLVAYTLLVLCVRQLRYACRPSLTSVYAQSFRCVCTYAGGACVSLHQCIRMGVIFCLQASLHDLFVPRALFSHFWSDLSLLKPETLEQINQGIERNGKQ
ncbi:hypothetical protein PIB30_092249, partial [Stylosanthes scabra]|nr:hypothetical protein [Stylosanthes scabra]